MAISLVIAFLPSLFPVNYLFASNNGPNAPEAAAFEPVDATDMVNLVTGDMSYVLPLLNVPSPEGGYPLSLAYHAGIAMDQEASWTGLGWSLNPGAINRGVNGYPDDWGKTELSEFFYDAGFQQTNYNLSVGVSINASTSVGLGLSWGSNKSLGGYVQASVGGISGSLGTNGASISKGWGGRNGAFGATISTNGIGIGYGSNAINRVGTTIGAGLNYNYNSGLSGGVSTSTSSYGLGVDFSSQGISVNGRGNARGIGISVTSNGVSSSDWRVVESHLNFYLPIYMFYVGYGQQKLSYSLFKYDRFSTSGILNPVLANRGKPYDDGSGPSKLMYENTFMDVTTIPRYDETTKLEDLIDPNNLIDNSNLVLPSYDNYAVSAQGLSGVLKPYLHTELNLAARGRSNRNQDNLYLQYLNNDLAEYQTAVSSGINVNRDALKKVNFTMDNAYNSFLRLETSEISNPSLPNSAINSDNVLNSFATSETNTFTNSNSLYTGNINQKREGNFIETFTNKEIRDASVSPIHEALGLDRTNTNVFLDEGIGAYRITTADGRTYHYSLPVYNFENIYKAFKNPGLEDQNFFELKKNTPYATHWLLTGVTGPDYIDLNGNGRFDTNDQGYWVEFEYGKWSDGYVWKTPSGRYQEDTDSETGEITYSYAWGRKQIYYLDAVKTRTHTALFVKSLREDNTSADEVNVSDLKWNPGLGTFNPQTYAKKWTREKVFKQFGRLPDIGYDSNGNVIQLGDDKYYEFKGGISRYFELPKNRTLKLDRVLLLKNQDFTLNKASGNLLNTESGYLNENSILKDCKVYDIQSGELLNTYSTIFIKPILPEQIDIHTHQNVLDIKDIEGAGLEAKAQQVIEMDYDYSLAQGSYNSDAAGKGRLALRNVNFKGKQGIQVIPPYKFSYFNTSSSYTQNNRDAWGYNKVYPQAWSLNQIETPVGGKIKIEYESDSYYVEAAVQEKKSFPNVSSVTTTGNEIRFNLDGVTENLNDYFKIGANHQITYDLVEYVEEQSGLSFYESRTSNEHFYEVIEIGSDYIKVEAENSNTDLHQIGYDSNSSCDPQVFQPGCIDLLTINGRMFDYTMDGNLEGALGGGIRVKQLQVVGDNGTLTTEYLYNDPETLKTTGITSYAPSDETKAIPYVSELPSPTVMYGTVRLLNKDNNGALTGSTSYEFETLEPFYGDNTYLFNLGDAFRVEEQQNETYNGGKVVANKFTIYNNLGMIGRLLSVASYNSLGHKLSEKKNQYRIAMDSNSEIGVTQESHKSLKRVLRGTTNENLTEKFYVSSTSKVSYPNVLESSTVSEGGIIRSSSFDQYDFLTGQVLETSTTNSQNKQIKSVILPAYRQYSAMGSKMDNVFNKNMLLQSTMNTSLFNNNGSWEKIGADITTWAPETYDYPINGVTYQTDVWRKHKTYVWDGDTDSNGFFTNFVGAYDGFDWTNDNNANSRWKQISEISKYNKYSMPLEVVDINGNKATTKMGDNDSKAIAIGNTGNNQMRYSGAEYLSGGNFDDNISAVGRSDERAHTGSYSIKINSQQGFRNVLTDYEAGKYKVSVWASKDNYSNARINDGSGLTPFNGEQVIAGDWVQLNHYVDLNGASKTIYVSSASGTTYFDDFRVHPIATSMTSYVYNQWDELCYIIGPNNIANYYEYDAAGRLTGSFAEMADEGSFVGGFKKSSEYKYNYKGVGTLDDNGNGTIDGNEGLDPLGITRSAENGYSSPGTLTIIPTGGSGQFTYRFASGLVTNASEAEALPYGTSSSNNTLYVSTVPCSGGSYGYNAYAVKVEVRDSATGETKTSLAYYNKTCSSGGGDPQQ